MATEQDLATHDWKEFCFRKVHVLKHPDIGETVVVHDDPTQSESKIICCSSCGVNLEEIVEGPCPGDPDE